MSRLGRVGALAVPHVKRRGVPAPCFFVDAGDTSSYPGSGSVWTDISSYGLAGTIAGPSWNSSGWFNFTGGYCDWSPTPSAVPIGTAAITMQVVFKTTSASTGQEMFGLSDVGPAGRVALFIDPSGYVGIETNGVAVWTNVWAGASTWVVLTAVSTGPNKHDFALYVNGALVTSSTVGTNGARSVSSSSLQLRVGGIPYTTPYRFSGDIAIAKMWAGSLSSGQVDSEFQAIRSRFGL